jgi:hypothetical protein
MRCRRRWTLDKLAHNSSFLYSVDSDCNLVSASARPGNTSVYADRQSTRRRLTWRANDCMTPRLAGVCGTTQPVCLLCAIYCVRRTVDAHYAPSHAHDLVINLQPVVQSAWDFENRMQQTNLAHSAMPIRGSSKRDERRASRGVAKSRYSSCASPIVIYAPIAKLPR